MGRGSGVGARRRRARTTGGPAYQAASTETRAPPRLPFGAGGQREQPSGPALRAGPPAAARRRPRQGDGRRASRPLRSAGDRPGPRRRRRTPGFPVARSGRRGSRGRGSRLGSAGGRAVTAGGAFGWEEVDPEATIARLGRRGRYFAADGPLAKQVEELAGEPGDPALADQVFAHQGTALDRIADVAYELMRLPRPRVEVAPIAVPIPRSAHAAPTAWWFAAHETGDGIMVDRFPASETVPAGARLLAHVHDADPRRPAAATVVVGTADLTNHPGAYVAVDGTAITLRGFNGVLVAESGLDSALVAAALHTWVFQLGREVPRGLRVNGCSVQLAASPQR